ncbi:MAG: tRNA (uracil-5-)-methyltransferase [Gammaproteobacteria bacterium BRH_c0]|nr:MAG: tRNA (uracil-5-)-methyltransferase [Gammaproteobacteria bacterium BRH_c0]
MIDPEHYQAQLNTKLDTLHQTFAGLPMPAVEVFASPPLHFRMRAEFRIWHQGEGSFYAMTAPGDNKPSPISDFPIGSRAMVDTMPALLEAINREPLLRRKLYGAEFLTTRDGQVLVTLIYHRPLGEEWQQVAHDLGQQLGIDIVGRSRRQKVVTDRDYVLESFVVAGKTLTYQQVETGFTQPNAAVNEQMLNWAFEVSRNSGGDLLELYCGNGNFTLALAPNFRRVLATEVSKLSVNSANYNINLNHIDTVDVVRMSSEEFTQALNGVRPFKRLRHIDLASYDFSTLFVDPPRAGLDPDTVALARGFGRILYISCNPLTLKENLEALCTTHRVVNFAVFDQFPYTHHLECGVLLEKC